VDAIHLHAVCLQSVAADVRTRLEVTTQIPSSHSVFHQR